MARWDYIIVGSGFGGSVCALRLAEKGYRVLVLEKGRRFSDEDFPRTNWDLRRWLWAPAVGCRGLFAMTFLPHLTALSGVGVGGGSLVYANTLPIPADGFYRSSSWAHLADWRRELEPHYREARRMLGATTNTVFTDPDLAVQEAARILGLEERCRPTTIGVYLGEPGVTVPDPYFGGEGPSRTGCRRCGACMLGCPHNAKNTLDKNYLYLAEKRGVVIQAESEVVALRPAGEGYLVEVLQGISPLPGRRTRRRHLASRVVLAGGVLGTLRLLLRMREDPRGLPRLSPLLGHGVRTNSEVLVGITTRRRDLDMSRGVAIGTILESDEHSHLEPVRYPEGSDFFRLLASPHVEGATPRQRLGNLLRILARDPFWYLKAWCTPGFARSTLIMLYMRTIDSHLRIHLGRSPMTGFRRDLTTSVEKGKAPTNYIPEASRLANTLARVVDGSPRSLITETLLGIPTTAHILGGCCMGASPQEGVIDHRHRVFGYPGLYVADGSAVSANPGVNPSLTICAMAERAMSFIRPRTG